MSLRQNLENFALRVATEAKALRTLINGNAADLSGLTTTTKSTLVDAINELDAAVDAAAASGGAHALDELNDVALTSPSVGHILRRDNTGQFVNVNGTDYYDAAGSAAAAQAASQPIDSDLTAIAALNTTAFGRSVLTLADEAAFAGLVPTATVDAPGRIEIATQTEVDSGADLTRAVTPGTLATRLAAFQAAGNYQPADDDLTAIAALATTTFGRDLLTLADQAALVAAVGAASTVTQGVVELATPEETVNGTSGALAATPAGVAAAVSALVDAAPGTLDTLNELAAALGDDPNFATTISNQIANKQNIDPFLTALSALDVVPGTIIYGTGTGLSLADLTAYARGLLAAETAAAARDTLSVYSRAEIGDPETNFVAVFESALV